MTGIIECPVCHVPTQRTVYGTPLDGLLAHQEAIHPDQRTVARVEVND